MPHGGPKKDKEKKEMHPTNRRNGLLYFPLIRISEDTNVENSERVFDTFPFPFNTLVFYFCFLFGFFFFFFFGGASSQELQDSGFPPTSLAAPS